MINHEHRTAYVIIGEVHVVKEHYICEPKILFLHVEGIKEKKRKTYRYMKDDS